MGNKTTMINNVTDLKSRTMVESNTLKSIILSSTDDRLPARDDILIHEYQIANSVTINSILSNYIVNLKYAWKLLDNPEVGQKESYFQIVDSLSTSRKSLSDDTNMVMEVVNGRGTFKARKLEFKASKVDLDKNVVSFHCLDSVWYGKQRNVNEETGKTHDGFVIVKGMNDFYVNPNPYGMNIFDAPMAFGDTTYDSFNEYAKGISATRDFIVTSIDENMFYHNDIGDGDIGFSRTLSMCRYIVCMDNGLYGLQPMFDPNTKEFSALRLNDLGAMIENIDSQEYRDRKYAFKSCSFQVVDGITSLVVVVVDYSGIQHYLFMNEDSYDSLYGLREMKSVVVDGLVVNAIDVFTNVEAVRQLDDVCIALTNYGFWDIEPNTTDYVTYAYVDQKEYLPAAQQGNAIKTKIVRPEFVAPALGKSKFKISEYDKRFDPVVFQGNGASGWSCSWEEPTQAGTETRTMSYLDVIKSPSGEQHKFVGGTESFGIYNATDDENAYILPRMDYPQFKEMLFSSPDLMNDLLDYFYMQSVHSPSSDGGLAADDAHPYGEYYLYVKREDHARTLNNLMKDRGFSDRTYSMTSGDLIPDKFDSILSLLRHGNDSALSLHSCCTRLDSLLNTTKDISWLVRTGPSSGSTSESYLKGVMDNYFIQNEYDSQKGPLQKTIIDSFVGQYPLLGHFQEYLDAHVQTHLATCPAGGISQSGDWTGVVTNVREMIKNQVLTALILKDGNYTGIQSYLYHHIARVNKTEIRSIFSIENIKNQMVLGVKSTPFFNDSHSYLEMKEMLEDYAQAGNMFKMEYNKDFASQTGLLDSNGKVKVTWNGIREFLYPPSGGEIGEQTILRAFVRTQIYRTLYFDPQNYDNFTIDPSKYTCQTEKSYVNHENETHVLVWPAGATTHDTSTLNVGASGLNPSGRNYRIVDPQIDSEHNALTYRVEYDPISIQDDKFVYQDVEHYVKRNDDGEIVMVLFNQFQKEIQSACKETVIDQYGVFVLNGKRYELEYKADNVPWRISVDDATEKFSENAIANGQNSAQYKEYKCEIVDDRFNMDGVWYALVKDDDGNYVGLSYAGVDDNKLTYVPVNSTGECRIEGKSVKFMFYGDTSEWDTVKAVLDYQTEIMDKVTGEWCAFDDLFTNTYRPPEEASYDWYLSNLIVDIARVKPNVKNLGDGVLYQGGLDQTTCSVELAHEVQGGDVVSKCVLVKKVGNEPETKHYIGGIYDKNMRIVNGKVLRGNLGSDGTFTSDPAGDIFIMVDPKGKKNNTNMVRIAKGVWNENVEVEREVGVVSVPDDNTGVQSVDFGLKEGYPRFLTVKLVDSTKDNNITYNWYQVSPTPDGAGKYRVRQAGNFIYVFVDGVRYALNMKTRKVDRLRFDSMPASVMDFSTQYSFEQLRNNLLNNLKQYMMNEIVQTLITNGSLTQISLNPSRLNLYLDLFPDDVSLSNYRLVNPFNGGDEYAKELYDKGCAKFHEVFKNSLIDIDDSDVYRGKAYGFLYGKLYDAFSVQNNFVLLDIDTIIPQLVNNQNDTFRYEVLFDLHLMQNKSLMKDNTYAYQKKWFVGDMTVRKLWCIVTFTPKYTPSQGTSAGSMKYTATYRVKGNTSAGTCNVDYAQIVYCLDGKVKKKAIPSLTKENVPISEFTYSDGEEHDLSDITSETIAEKIEQMFTDTKIREYFVGVNNAIGTKRLLVDTESKKNPVPAGSEWTYGGTWELDQQIPPNLPGTLVYVNRGNVVIDGEVYNVVGEETNGTVEDKYIEQADGPGKFELVPMQVHKEDETEAGDNYNSISNKEMRKVAKGGEIVTRQSAEALFTVEKINNTVYLKFKNDQVFSKYAHLYPSLSGQTSFSLQEVAHLEELANLLTTRTLTNAPDDVPQDEAKRYWYYEVRTATYNQATSKIHVVVTRERQSKDGSELQENPVTLESFDIDCSTLTNFLLLNPAVYDEEPSYEDDEDVTDEEETGEEDEDEDESSGNPDEEQDVDDGSEKDELQGVYAIGQDLTTMSSFSIALSDEQVEAINALADDGEYVVTSTIPFSGYYTYEQEIEVSDEEEEEDTSGTGHVDDDYIPEEGDGDDSEYGDDGEEYDEDDNRPVNVPDDDSGEGDVPAQGGSSGQSGDSPQTITETKTSGWFGIEGQFSVKVVIQKGEAGELTVKSAVITDVAKPTCRSLTTLSTHDLKLGQECQDSTLYTIVRNAGSETDPEWVDVADNSHNLTLPLADVRLETQTMSEKDPDSSTTTEEEGDEDEESGGEGEGEGSGEEGGEEPPVLEETRPSKISVTFKVKARITNQLLALSPDDTTPKYIVSDVVIGKRGGSFYVMGICLMTDFLGNPVGDLDYGYVEYPTNLTDLVAALESPDQKIKYYDIEYKTTYFRLNSAHTGIMSDGLYCPFAVHVLGPDETSGDDGYIYNRFYEISMDVYADHSNIPASTISDGKGKFWMDKAGTLKSLHRLPTSETYKKLSCIKPAYIREDPAVPEQMRESIQKLVDERCKLDDGYFNSVLVQLKQFLQMVFDELEAPIDKTGFLSMCNFKYSKTVTFQQHTSDWSSANGVFGYDRTGTSYVACRDNFNNYLKGEFKGDFASLADVVDVFLLDNPDTNNGDRQKRRDYNWILLPYDSLKVKISNRSGYGDWAVVDAKVDQNRLLTALNRFRESIIVKLHSQTGNPDSPFIDTVFSAQNRETVRYIGAVKLDISGQILDMFVADGYCNLLHRTSSGIRWNRFISSSTATNALLDRKAENKLDYTYQTTMMEVFGIIDRDWLYRFGNRDLDITSTISDQFFLHCHDDEHGDSWYHSEIGGYLYSEESIVDMAYEQHGNSTYVLFSEDPYLYRYDNLEQMKDFDGYILLQKENATMKIETRHSTKITGKPTSWDWIYIDYETPDRWTIDLYGMLDDVRVMESWKNSPGIATYHFLQYNNVMFGDTLFDNNQLKFQNISKNKEMFDILDIYEVDGNYYGMFDDDTEGTPDGIYAVFKSGLDSEVVQKLPYQITNPSFYRSVDDLYSLFVVEKVQQGDTEDYKTILREISVPDSDLYRDRVINIEDVIPKPDKVEEPLEIKELIMSKFRPNDSKTTFFVLSNWGFHKVGYVNKFTRVSIDTLDELKNRLWYSLKNTIIQKHVKEKHESEEQQEYFNEVAGKVNQFADDFDMFSLIPAEFGETQDVGVIPDSRIDDTDRDTDHRADSVLMSTDILQTQGMVAQTDTNPGIVTGAVSNPSTTYNSNPDVMKSQRNPSIQGSGFYDFIYDSDGNVLLDLYSMPFIYQVNSNNTYDLYINVPTTRTKYLNRIAGTLTPDLTTQVLPEDARVRKNFQNAGLPNNLNESTTKLRIYIDRKFISVGNVELVEISGNSIPLQIYRDTPNNGLYDSIALESRWDGVVNWIKEPEKDINKVMLEFECYGTDSQSIHIQGKTIVNRALDDKTYIFG